MKFFLLLALALVGVVAGAQLPDSATQGPNPQDIATPEPEYIDIDEPLPAAAAPAAAPRPVFAAAPPGQIAAPIARPIARPVAQQTFVQQQQPFIQQQQQPIAQRVQYLAPQVVPQQQQQQLVGHSFNSRSGYQYRRPVYVRRFYRLRRY
ncbi:LOW QUALITY PROTEIN: gamma-gliadin B-I [Drosophila obscura]|uniref:LOW QUALITY PROTEIN: gamma-gliadin B-I n=1 Tax=Drosophila obscura TaxID=7282 RepID=UPI001BB259BA|nr:LOW QUALITY PROTEIN: gamma-gliadin B-I [Drosophila obscura]